MKKVLFKDIKDMDKFLYTLGEEGVSLSQVLKQLKSGKDAVELSLESDKLERLRKNLEGVCSVEILEEKGIDFPYQPVLIFALILENAIVFNILKLSFLSQDFYAFVNGLFSSPRSVEVVIHLSSFIFILLYFYSLVFFKKRVLVFYALGLSFFDEKKNLQTALLSFSVPLIALYLLSGGVLLKLLGLVLFSLSVALALQVKVVKFS